MKSGDAKGVKVGHTIQDSNKEVILRVTNK